MNRVRHGCLNVSKAWRATQVVIVRGLLRALNIEAIPALAIAIVCISYFFGRVQAQSPQAGLISSKGPVTVSPRSDYEIRTVWGGGATRSFDGEIQVTGGTVELVRNLSLQDDAVGTIRRKSPTELKILPHSASTFGGADLRIHGDLDTVLSFRFRELPDGEPGPVRSVKLHELLSGRWMQQLDASGTRLAAERLIYDRIRVDLGRAQPIFKPSEACDIQVSGHHTGLAAGEYRLRLRLVSSATNKLVTSQVFAVDLDTDGSFSPVKATSISLPEQAGVYTFEISLQRKRLINSIISSIAIADRRLELVVTDDRAITPLTVASAPASHTSASGMGSGKGSGILPNSTASAALATTAHATTALANSMFLSTGLGSSAPEDGQHGTGANLEDVDRVWRPLSSVFPAGASWWDALGRFSVPTSRALTPLVTPAARPIGSGNHTRRVVGGNECLVLGGSHWQAFPLHVQGIGHAHRIRVRVPNDRAMSLALSIQEPNAGGDAAGLRQDSGLVVDPSGVTGIASDTIEHSLVFWPRTSQPYLLLLNTESKREASIRSIELEIADGPLAPSPFVSLKSLEVDADDREPSLTMPAEASGAEAAVPVSDIEPDTRLVSLYLDKPLLAENFGAQRSLDGHNERALDSWQTWVDASQRFAEYTHWSGYNAATVTIATQGSCIYPSKLLEPSPKFDSGVFLSDGSDPEVKDLVELVCREFDRRNLRLVLALDIDGTLPKLTRWEESQTAEGSIFQADLDGKAWQSQDRKDGARFVRYNPLDNRVQTALEHVVKEVLDRYSGHPCFAGVQINLSNRSHFAFAGDRWGYDAASIMRFERAIGTRMPADLEQRKQLLQTSMRLNFLNHRANELAMFYRRLGEQVESAKPSARLILNPAKLLSTPPEADGYVSLDAVNRSGAELMLACGLAPQVTDSESAIRWLRPESDSPLRSPVARAWGFQIASDMSLDTLLTEVDSGCILQQIPNGYRLPDFDAASPFGNEKTRAWLFPHASRGGADARRQLVNRIYQDDQCAVELGGWLAVMGQERELRSLLRQIGSLPNEKFQDQAVQGVSQLMKVRKLSSRNETTWMIINNASWAETVELQLATRLAAPVVCLTSHEGVLNRSTETAADGQMLSKTLQLEPYSIAIIRVGSSHVEMPSIASRPEPGVTERLEQRLLDLQSSIDSAGELSDQQVLGLVGGDFEEWSVDNKPKGWTASALPNVRIAQESELPHSGRNCLLIENSGSENTTAWIQSERIAVPPTGRLAIEVWVRSAPGLEQPGVRVSLIGRFRDGKRFHRWHDFTRSTRGPGQIPNDWGKRPLVLLVPDVPSDELSELNVAVDVVGPGKLWIDDVRAYGMYLHPDEKVHLLGQIYLAKEKLRMGELGPTEQLVHSYWAYFLSTYLAAGQVSSRPPAQAAISRTADNRTPSSAPKQGGNSGVTPAWKAPTQPRANSWQENWRNRWQK